MTTSLKLRRGTTAQHASFTGAEGEVTVDTTKDTVVVHDGATAGGFPLAKEKFLQTGTGATARTVDLKLKEFVSVLDFGAVGDGVADDTAAIQAAISTGKPVNLMDSSKVYKVTSTIVYTGKVVLIADGATIKADVLPFRFTNATGSRVSGIKFLPITTPYTLLRNTSTWVNVVGDVVQSLEGYVPTTQDADIWSSLSAPIQNQWSSFNFGGIHFCVSSTAGGSDVVVENLTGYQFCITLEGYSNSVVRDCNFGGKREGVVFLNGVSDYTASFTLPQGKSNSVVNNKIRYAAQCAILFWGNDKFTISGNSVSLNGESGIKTYQYDASNTTAVISTNGIIENNQVFDNYYDGIDAQIVYGAPAVDAYVSGTHITANRCVNNRATGITINGKYGSVVGNSCSGNGSHGISVKGAHFTVSGNMLRQNTAFKSFWAFQIFDLIIQGDGMLSVGNYVYNTTAPDTYNYLHSGVNGVDPANGLEGLDIGNRCSLGSTVSFISTNIPSTEKIVVGGAGSNIGGAVATVRHGNGGGIDAGGATDGSGYLRVRGGSTNLGVLDFAKNATSTSGISTYDGRIAYDFNSTLMYLGIKGGNWKVYLQDGVGLYPVPDNVMSLGFSGLRWTQLYAATGTINTSDERDKDLIEPVDAAVLRAWAKVSFHQYKFKDAIEKKGDGARWHFGVVAQRVKEAFESEGLDAFAYGILCYDEWEETPASFTVDEETGEQVLMSEARPAGNRYGVRYDEALALECAYLRSRLGGV